MFDDMANHQPQTSNPVLVVGTKSDPQEFQMNSRDNAVWTRQLYIATCNTPLTGNLFSTLIHYSIHENTRARLYEFVLKAAREHKIDTACVYLCVCVNIFTSLGAARCARFVEVSHVAQQGKQASK